jgi:hypothetical protein
LDHDFGIKFSDYAGLAQGQFTIALLPLNDPDKTNQPYSPIILIDTRDRSEQLKTNLANVKKKWTAAGKTSKTDKIRDVEFTTFMTSSDDLSWQKLFPGKAKTPNADPDETNSPPKKFDLIVGQSDSLLIISDSTKTIEQVLSRQAGGLAPALEEQPAFQADFAGRLRGSVWYIWGNLGSVIGTFSKQGDTADDSKSSPLPKASALIKGAGLNDLTSISLSCTDSPEGLSSLMYLGWPENSRHGILKALVTDAKDSSPPPFVPADVVKFSRFRLNIPKSWTTLESALNEINPAASGTLNFFLQSAGT